MEINQNAVTERAYGRVNLIGEHTDYNLGFVLPTSIPQYTEVTVAKREGVKVSFRSSEDPKHGQLRHYTYSLGEEKKTNSWTDYLSGAILLLLKEGCALSGMDIQVFSSIPEGSGLSSSAALEISFLKAIRKLFDLNFKDDELARLGQRIENEFVGANVGIMDQMACALCRSGEALFLDTQNLHYERLPLHPPEFDLVVVNSGISHQISDGGYNERRAQCEAACAALKIHSLRELGIQDLKKLDVLPSLLKKRARHVITENARVIQSVDALKSGDLKTLGKYFHDSHLSMRDDYAVSIPQIDTLVELFEQKKEVYGARLTGGGFGGSIVAITEKGKGGQIANLILPEYLCSTGAKATVLVAGES